MTACEQIRLHAVVVDSFTLVLARLPRERDKTFSMHQKRAYITGSSDPGLRRIRRGMVFHHNEVMVSVSTVSCIVVYLLVRCASEHRHIDLHQ